MRSGAPTEVLTGAAGWWPIVQSWRGGTMLSRSVPVMRGRVTASVTSQVPERLTLTVPRFDSDGTDYLPTQETAETAPLAKNGQELFVSVAVWSSVTGSQYETRIGRYLITDWDYSDGADTIRVTAVGLLQRIADDRLTSPMSPRAGGSLMSEARRLMPVGMAAGFTGLTDRGCPRSMEWSEDRLGALYEIADAWPARLRTDAWGQVQFLPPLPEVPVPVISLTDGHPYRGLPGDPRATVVGADRSDTRDGAYNQIVARSSATDVDVQAIARQRSGPMAVTGPYGPVTKFWSSPLLTTQGAAQAAADSMLRSSLMPTRIVPVEMVPDPRIDLDDAVALRRDDMNDWGYVVGYDLPLTVLDGSMRLDLAVQA
jgi:hypothetical protein